MTLRAAPGDGAGAPEPRVDIIRSRRRRRTVSAYRDGDRTVVQLPAGLSRADEERWVADMLSRLSRREARTRAGGDTELISRAAELSARYFGGRAKPKNVRWVTNQNSRWGSCTPSDGTIRLSHRLRTMPSWVVDYVLVHELAHLLVAGHGPAFWELVELYPRTERARGFLEGVALTAGLDLSPGVDGDSPDLDLEQDLERDAADGPAA
jgi:predicted metal-dependent hydrolase